MRAPGLVHRIRIQKTDAVIHPLSTGYNFPDRFTDPFRYEPHPSVREAAGRVMSMITMMVNNGTISPEEAKSLAEGKMMGVLVIRESNGSLGYLAGFSGNVAGNSCLPGFVPPIFDLTAPDGNFKKGEAELNDINKSIRVLETSSVYSILKNKLSEVDEKLKEDILAMKAVMAASKQERDEIRCKTDDAGRLAILIKESQFQKAELHRIKERGKKEISELKTEIQSFENDIKNLKKLRMAKSDMLQKWIFEQYVVSDAAGNRKTVESIFAEQGLIPPGGTGECAAPKLLNYAYQHSLTPLAMGEFWYGASPSTAVRTHGHFYPSCTSKCGPLLGHMLNGIETHSADSSIKASAMPPVIIYEDDSIIVASKPSGMPSVPGLDGKESLLEWLQKIDTSTEAVHRLDMDTSGIMVFAKNSDAAVNLRSQFEKHTIKKEYLARLSPADSHSYAVNTPGLKCHDTGRISLPLGPDYDERPRQKVDRTHGKEALTEYEVVSTNPDGTTDILFFPHTGRTHQLRAHSAHTSGLGRPILGDLLYGGCGSIWSDTPSRRLHLHAFSITLTHPTSGLVQTFTTREHCYI